MTWEYEAIQGAAWWDSIYKLRGLKLQYIVSSTQNLTWYLGKQAILVVSSIYLYQLKENICHVLNILFQNYLTQSLVLQSIDLNLPFKIVFIINLRPKSKQKQTLLYIYTPLIMMISAFLFLSVHSKGFKIARVLNWFTMNLTEKDPTKCSLRCTY